MLLAIDPGNTLSAYVVLDNKLKPLRFAKIKNEQLLEMIYNHEFDDCNRVAIEMIASMGMSVGASVFETCVYIGRLKECIWRMLDIEPAVIYRKEEKMNLCGTMRAKDCNIIRALVDRFAVHDVRYGKGTKSNKDIFYGFKSDIWQAYAVGITYYDIYVKGG